LAAVWAGNADIADLLLQNGADIEARDNEGYTPFLMAALNGDTLLIKLLIKNGADIYAANNLNQNALSLSIIADQEVAINFLLRSGNKWASQGDKVLSPYVIATKYRRKNAIKILQDNKLPGKIKYGIDQIGVMASTRFSQHDIYTGASLSFKEPYLNTGFIVGYDAKLWYTRVLLKQSEHMFYQYMDKGSVFYAGLFKNFALTDNPFKANFEISTSLSGGIRFGNELKGTSYSPSDKFMIIPEVSVRWSLKDLSASLGAEYMNTDFYHVGPLWLRLGVSYNFYFDNVRLKKKTLKWY
jgi:hypothetical protein